MIVRGTTPLHTFALPFPISDISEVFVTYTQNDKVVIEKNRNDIEIDVETNTLFVPLSQDDTLTFKVYEKYVNNIVLIQMRVLMTDGSSCASEIIKERVSNVLKDGVITEMQEVVSSV